MTTEPYFEVTIDEFSEPERCEKLTARMCDTVCKVVHVDEHGKRTVLKNKYGPVGVEP